MHASSKVVEAKLNGRLSQFKLRQNFNNSILRSVSRKIPSQVNRKYVFSCTNSKEGEDLSDVKTGAGLKAVWYGAEQFGNLVGLSKKLKGEESSKSGGVEKEAGIGGSNLTREAAMELLREDYDQNYFVSGKGSMAAYDAECTFADPFVSFDGVERFKSNVSNLGGLMEDIDLKITGWEESEDSVATEWRFSCVLQLPHRPKLAASGGTTHIFDKSTGLVSKHIERWDVEPGVVVKQLLKPSAKFPTSKAEVFMMSVSEGDAKGVWFGISSYVLKYALVLVVLSALVNAISGNDSGVGFVDVSLYSLVIISGLTECVKLLNVF